MTPYYEDDDVTLYFGDWRKIIAPDFRADLILTDPPYGETNLEWDRWPDGWPALAARHADAMWCWGSMRMFLDRRDEFADWTFSQDIVWEKHNGSNLANDRFNRVHEFSLFWYQGAWADIHHEVPQSADATKRTIRKKARPAQWIGETGPTTYTSVDGGPRNMRSVMFARSSHGRALNETQKPESVNEHLMTYACPPGGTVLDLFAGSGTTGMVAKQTGRKAVLYELREDQCEAVARRLAQGVLDFGDAS